MRCLVLSVVGFLLAAGLPVLADDTKPDLSGTWKLSRGTEPDQANGDLLLVIDEKAQKIHIKETRGTGSKDEVSEFNCATVGTECEMRDGGDKAQVSVYYNGPVLVVWKTHGRKGDTVDKRRLTLAGDSLVMEVTHIEPQGKAEKLVFSKTQ